MTAAAWQNRSATHTHLALSVSLFFSLSLSFSVVQTQPESCTSWRKDIIKYAVVPLLFRVLLRPLDYVTVCVMQMRSCHVMSGSSSLLSSFPHYVAFILSICACHTVSVLLYWPQFQIHKKNDFQSRGHFCHHV